MKLSKRGILKAIDNKSIVIEPFDYDNLNPNSYNVTLHNELMVYTDHVLDMKKENPTKTIIIPEEGCAGCISEAEDFYMANKERKDLFFIFTNISSIKSIKLRVGKDVEDKENVFLDIDNDFLSEQFNENIYPIVFDIRDKDNITYSFLEPGIDLQIESPKE